MCVLFDPSTTYGENALTYVNHGRLKTKHIVNVILKKDEVRNVTPINQAVLEIDIRLS